MKQVVGDLLNIDKGVIAHQVNLYGVMGAGVARLLANKYSGLLPEYEEYCKQGANLGDVTLYQSENVTIANCFSQMQELLDQCDTITSYSHVVQCFNKLTTLFRKGTIYVPFGYGCGIAGGQWPIVHAILEQYKNIVIVSRYEDLHAYFEKIGILNIDRIINAMDVL